MLSVVGNWTAQEVPKSGSRCLEWYRDNVSIHTPSTRSTTTAGTIVCGARVRASVCALVDRRADVVCARAPEDRRWLCWSVVICAAITGTLPTVQQITGPSGVLIPRRVERGAANNVCPTVSTKTMPPSLERLQKNYWHCFFAQ
jgi:hypothetical protein